MGSLMNDWRAKKASEEQELYLRLAAALETGRIQMLLDRRLVDFQGSPVHNPWDQLAPLLVTMGISLLVLIIFGMVPGIISMTLAVLAQLALVRHWVNNQIFQRTKRYAMSGSAHFEYLWSLGAIGLTLEGDLAMPCVSPNGDWRNFTRRALHLHKAMQDPAEGEVTPPDNVS